MNINLTLNNDSTSLEALKLCLLYCDNVTLNVLTMSSVKLCMEKREIFIERTDILANDLKESIKLLQNENLIKLNFDYNNEIPTSDILNNILEVSGKSIVSYLDQLVSESTKTNGSLCISEGSFITSQEALEMINNLSTPDIRNIMLKSASSSMNLDFEKLKQEGVSHNIIDILLLVHYLSFMLNHILINITQGQVTISNSQIISTILGYI